MADIFYQGVQWVEIFQVADEMRIEFCKHPQNNFWDFTYAEAIQILEQAKTELLIRKKLKGQSRSEISVNVSDVNEQGQRILESILNHPEKKVLAYVHKINGSVIDIYAPDIGGVRFNGEGTEMIGFLEPHHLYMSKNEFSVIIANDDDREKVFAEILCNGDLWAEISQEEENPMVRFFPPSNAKYWEFSYAETIHILEQAKIILLGV